MTGVPVHTNAYWELSSNRRDIWRAEDTQGESKMRSHWNELVMKDVLAPLYAHLVMKIVSSSTSSPAQVLDLLPCPLPTEPWNGMSTPLFNLLREQKFLHSKLNGGIFVSPWESFLIANDQPDTSKMSKEEQDEETSSRITLENILLRESLPVARVPTRVLQAFVTEEISLEVSPTVMREYLSGPPKHGNSHVILLSEHYQDALFLLQYCFKDINKTNYNSLHRLPLLPLHSNGFGVISNNECSDDSYETYYTVSAVQRQLIAQCGDRIIAEDSVLGTYLSLSLSLSLSQHDDDNEETEVEMVENEYTNMIAASYFFSIYTLAH